MLRWLGLSMSFFLVPAITGSQTAFPHPMGEAGVHFEYLGKASTFQADKKAIMQLIFEDSDPAECVLPGQSAAQMIDNTRVARVALHDTGKTEILVQASDNCHCGATGNCDLWVVRRTQKGFEVLLEIQAVLEVSIEPSSTNGYRDLMTSTHESAFMTDLTLHKFDGKQYQKSACAEIEYRLQNDGTNSKTPTITAAECLKN
jgi:hypothetical protein